MTGVLRVCEECGKTFASARKRRTCSTVCMFWSLIDKSGGPESCWPWTSNISSQTGYGNVPGKLNGGRRISAHRKAWQHANCCDPDRLCVLHRCDNRICANPKHLFIGTHRTNLLDCALKGRVNACSPGESHPKAILTDAIVKKLRVSHETTRDLAERYGVRCQTIQHARDGRSWRHLPMPDEMAAAGSEDAKMLGFRRIIAPTSTESQRF